VNKNKIDDKNVTAQYKPSKYLPGFAMWLSTTNTKSSKGKLFLFD